MSRGVVLRAEVPSDIHSIIAFLEQDNLRIAEKFRVAVFAALEDLADMPGKGSPKHFRSKQLRDVRTWWIPGFRKFLILYKPVADGVDVLAIVHGARRLSKLL